MVMRSRHDASPHSHTRSSGCVVRAKPSARSSILSFTSRNTASFRPMRSSRLIELNSGGLLDHDVSVSSRDDFRDGLLRLLVSDRGHEPVWVLAQHGVLSGCQVEDLHATLDRALAEKRDAFHRDAELIRPVAKALVCLAEAGIVRLDPLRDRVRHLALICANR